jgi:hypothetical protein
MYRFKIFKELELISVCLSGDIYFADMIDFHLHLFANPYFMPHYQGLSDLRNGELKMNLSEMNQLHTAITELGGITGRWAHLINTPRKAALSMKYADASAHAHQTRVVHSLDEAELFLGYNDLSPYLLAPAG